MNETVSVSRRTSNKKVWRFVSVILDHEKDKYICIQVLDGDWGEPNTDGHDAQGWRDADLPAATRMVRVTIDELGTARTLHAPYSGDRVTLRDN
jgi:hypothetical protein